MNDWKAFEIALSIIMTLMGGAGALLWWMFLRLVARIDAVVARLTLVETTTATQATTLTTAAGLVAQVTKLETASAVRDERIKPLATRDDIRAIVREELEPITKTTASLSGIPAKLDSIEGRVEHLERMKQT